MEMPKQIHIAKAELGGYTVKLTEPMQIGRAHV